MHLETAYNHLAADIAMKADGGPDSDGVWDDTWDYIQSHMQAKVPLWMKTLPVENWNDSSVTSMVACLNDTVEQFWPGLPSDETQKFAQGLVDVKGLMDEYGLV